MGMRLVFKRQLVFDVQLRAQLNFYVDEIDGHVFLGVPIQPQNPHSTTQEFRQISLKGGKKYNLSNSALPLQFDYDDAGNYLVRLYVGNRGQHFKNSKPDIALNKWQVDILKRLCEPGRTRRCKKRKKQYEENIRISRK